MDIEMEIEIEIEKELDIECDSVYLIHSCALEIT
jgi:hypothetical protein